MDDEGDLLRSTPLPLAEAGAWCRERGIRLCVAYGSRARGTARPDSDLDLALWPAEPSPVERMLAWRRELTEATGIPVQMILVTADLDPVLGLEIARDGVPLHEADEGTWARERLRLWHAYQDALPFLRAARRNLQQFAAEVRDGS